MIGSQRPSFWRAAALGALAAVGLTAFPVWAQSTTRMLAAPSSNQTHSAGAPSDTVDIWANFATRDQDKAKKKKVTWEKVEKKITEHFLTLDGYEKGDLISQGNVTHLWRELRRIGFKVESAGEIEKTLLADNDFLVKTLSTNKGKAFMRRVKSIPQVYDRLDRMCQLSNGRDNLTIITQNKGGEKLMKVLGSSTGASTVEQWLADDPQGRNFSEPTGKIYTEEELVSRLRAVFEEQTRAAENNTR